jgi:hypothetical protein
MSAYDDLYINWGNDDQEEKTESKWKIVNYFIDTYLKTEVDLEQLITRIGVFNLIHDKANEFYDVVVKNNTGPKDIAKFIINLNLDFLVNVKADYVSPILEFVNENPSTEKYVTYFTTKFPKILERYAGFERVISCIITLANKKFKKNNVVNEVTDNSSNSFNSQNLITNLDPLTDTFDFSSYNDEEIELNDEDQIDGNDDDDSDSDTPTISTYEDEQNSI